MKQARLEYLPLKILALQTAYILEVLLQEEGYACQPQLLQASTQLPAVLQDAANARLLSGFDAICQPEAQENPSLAAPMGAWTLAWGPRHAAIPDGSSSNQHSSSAALLRPGRAVLMQGLTLLPSVESITTPPDLTSMQEGKRLASTDVVYKTEYRASSPAVLPAGKQILDHQHLLGSCA